MHLLRKDSVTLALVTSLKKEVGLDDQDIEINVEKGVWYLYHFLIKYSLRAEVITSQIEQKKS